MGNYQLSTNDVNNLFTELNKTQEELSKLTEDLVRSFNALKGLSSFEGKGAESIKAYFCEVQTPLVESIDLACSGIVNAFTPFNETFNNLDDPAGDFFEVAFHELGGYSDAHDSADPNLSTVGSAVRKAYARQDDLYRGFNMLVEEGVEFNRFQFEIEEGDRLVRDFINNHPKALDAKIEQTGTEALAKYIEVESEKDGYIQNIQSILGACKDGTFSPNNYTSGMFDASPLTTEFKAMHAQEVESSAAWREFRQQSAEKTKVTSEQRDKILEEQERQKVDGWIKAGLAVAGAAMGVLALAACATPVGWIAIAGFAVAAIGAGIGIVSAGCSIKSAMEGSSKSNYYGPKRNDKAGLSTLDHLGNVATGAEHGFSVLEDGNKPSGRAHVAGAVGCCADYLPSPADNYAGVIGVTGEVACDAIDLVDTDGSSKFPKISKAASAAGVVVTVAEYGFDKQAGARTAGVDAKLAELEEKKKRINPTRPPGDF